MQNNEQPIEITTATDNKILAEEEEDCVCKKDRQPLSFSFRVPVLVRAIPGTRYNAV